MVKGLLWHVFVNDTVLHNLTILLSIKVNLERKLLLKHNGLLCGLRYQHYNKELHSFLYIGLLIYVAF